MKPISRSRAILISGAVYFAIVYAAGFVLGSLRQLVLAPEIGAFPATLIEAPLMLIVCYLAARWVVPNTGGAGGYLTAIEKLGIGLFAFTILIAAEILLGGLMRGWGVAEWFSHLATPEGMLSGLLFIIFAVMPVAVPVPRH